MNNLAAKEQKKGLPPFTHIIQALPSTVPFIAPEVLERRSKKTLKLRMGANESGFGISLRAQEAIWKAIERITLYGDPESYELREKLASIHGISIKNLVIGCGIDDLLGLIVRTFIEPGDIAISSFGTYPTFSYHIAGYGGQLHSIPYRKDSYIDLQALAETAREVKARLIYLANPDNPTGTYYTAANLKLLIEQLPPECLLILDEAYIEFAPTGSVLAIDTNSSHIIRLRTFSKVHGMAGARIGYAIAAQEIIDAFEKIRLHFGVNRIAQAGALASLNDPQFLQNVVCAVEKGRYEYEALARDMGILALPSATNFVAIDMGSAKQALTMLNRLLERGVFIRIPNVPPLDRYIRVTIGTPQEREVFSEIFRELFTSKAL